MSFEDEVKQYVNEKITYLGFNKSDSNDIIKIYINKYNNYEINITKLNSDNIRCELREPVIDLPPYFVLTSCVISSWDKSYLKKIDAWIENMFLIPDMKPFLRMCKLKQLKENDRKNK